MRNDGLETMDYDTDLTSSSIAARLCPNKGCVPADFATFPNQHIFISDKFNERYCIRREGERRCKVRASMSIIVVIILMNAVKAGCILFTLFDGTTTLVTLGDAICSFIKQPDPTTKGYCTLSKYGVARGRWRGDPSAQYWKPERLYRREANTRHQWILSNAW